MKLKLEKLKLEKLKKLEKERALREKLREKEQLEKQRARERAEKEREKLRLDKEREKERALREKLREKEQLEKQRARERAEKEREKLRLDKEREKERVRREKEKAREQQEKERAKALAQKAREEERERLRKAAADEKARKIQERDAARELARRQKEEERAKLIAEREAYRKAKEAERERLRAEREAARRALEGKVARASKRLARQDGMGRGTSSTRVYRPDAIPDQSGTTRRGNEAVFRPLGVRPITASALSSIEDIAASAPLSDVASAPGSGEAARPTPPPPPITLSVEERYQLIMERLGRADASFQREYRENFDMSWIYHDSALEGVVYTFQELKTAVDPSAAVVPDSSLQPACEEIRRHRLAIELVRDLAERKRVPINVDMVKKLYVTLHPEEGDVKTVKYRKDIPQHRLYFHEYVPPDKIAYRVRQIVDWLNGPEPKKMKNPLRVAARVHYDLVRVFPFQTDSGKVSRLLMNLILMRSGYPPAIIHSTERQRYYEALKGQLPIIITMVADAISNALLSIEKLLDDYEAKPRSGTTIAGSTSVS
jgi:Fic family protein